MTRRDRAEARAALIRTMRAYDTFAVEYRDHCPRPDVMKKQLDYFVSTLRGLAVLDLGCGAGRDLTRLLKMGFKPTGVDLSVRLLQLAQSGGNTRLARMDMRRLGFLRKTFDGVWMCASLFHIPKRDAEGVLGEIHKVLRPDGLLFITVKEGKGEKFVETRPGFSRFYSFYNMNELLSLLARGRFRIRRRYREDRPDSSLRAVPWLDVFAEKDASHEDAP